jgi:amino acid transporter
MPKVVAFQAGFITLMSGCITSAANVIILIQYLSTVAPAVGIGEPGSFVIMGAVLLFVLVLNVMGISSIGPFTKILTALILIPFAVMFFISLRYANETGHLLGTISPIIRGEGSVASSKVALQGYLGALVLNMLGFSLPAACAGSVQNVNTVFPRAMLLSVVLVILNFTIPIATGVLASRYENGNWGCGPYPNAIGQGTDGSDFQWSSAQCSPEFNLLSSESAITARRKCSECLGGRWTHWQTGYFSVVAYVLGGKPLQWIIVLVALLGQLGTILSGICCNAYSVKALADLEMLPKFVGTIYSKFDSPVVAICIVMSVTAFVALFFNWFQVNGGGAAFDNLAFSASLLTLLVNSVMLVAFLMLRNQQPDLIRPFRIPLKSVFSCFLFCLPTLLITGFFISVCELADVVLLFIILFVGFCLWYGPILWQIIHKKREPRHEISMASLRT